MSVLIEILVYERTGTRESMDYALHVESHHTITIYCVKLILVSNMTKDIWFFLLIFT